MSRTAFGSCSPKLNKQENIANNHHFCCEYSMMYLRQNCQHCFEQDSTVHCIKESSQLVTINIICNTTILSATYCRASAFPLMYSFPFSDVRYGVTTMSPSWRYKVKNYIEAGLELYNHVVTYHSNREGKGGGVCSCIKDIDIHVAW